jgi:hypothetical protein
MNDVIRREADDSHMSYPKYDKTGIWANELISLKHMRTQNRNTRTFDNDHIASVVFKR